MHVNDIIELAKIIFYVKEEAVNWRLFKNVCGRKMCNNK